MVHGWWAACMRPKTQVHWSSNQGFVVHTDDLSCYITSNQQGQMFIQNLNRIVSVWLIILQNDLNNKSWSLIYMMFMIIIYILRPSKFNACNKVFLHMYRCTCTMHLLLLHVTLCSRLWHTCFIRVISRRRWHQAITCITPAITCITPAITSITPAITCITPAITCISLITTSLINLTKTVSYRVETKQLCKRYEKIFISILNVFSQLWYKIPLQEEIRSCILGMRQTLFTNNAANHLLKVPYLQQKLGSKVHVT